MNHPNDSTPPDNGVPGSNPRTTTTPSGDAAFKNRNPNNAPRVLKTLHLIIVPPNFDEARTRERIMQVKVPEEV